MSRLIDVDKLNRKDVNCANIPMNFIDTAPTVEAIPKADYESRLKADMVAMLTEIQLEIEELDLKDSVSDYQKGAEETREYIANMIEQKINALKETSND